MDDLKELIRNFDTATVQTLNERQLNLVWPICHPYTCPDRGDSYHGREGGDKGVLIATVDGWVCPYCGYTQNWAHTSSVEDFDDRLAAAPGEIQELVQKMIGEAGRKAEELLGAYRRLAVDIEFRNIGPTESKDQRLKAVHTMVDCLHRFRLAQYGIETRPGKSRGISSDWVSVDTRLPNETDGKVFEVICERHPEDRKSQDPIDGHLEIKSTEIAQGIFAKVYRFDIEMLGWKAHWWRPAGESAVNAHLDAKTPYLHIHVQREPHGDVLIEGNACGLLKLKFLLDGILHSREKSADFYDADGEGYSVRISETPSLGDPPYAIGSAARLPDHAR